MAIPFPGVFQDPEKMSTRRPLPGIHMALGWGRRMMLSRVTIDAGAEIPEHRHPHEQAGVCLEGEFELTVAGETRKVRAGDLYLIPGDAPHSVRGLDGHAVTVDIFSPLRDDYMDP